MSLSVNSVTFAGTEPRPSQVKTAGGAQNTQLLKQCGGKDEVCFKGGKKQELAPLTDSEKKEIIRSARTKAAGWAFFFGPFSTAYYALRSNNTIAEKYELDKEQDKALIKEIKTQQAMWTLPSILPGVGIITGGIAWLYNKNMDAEKIDL